MIHPKFKWVAWAALALCLCVISFGGYVRLSHAGLGCPDWPVCYGKLTWPKQEIHINAANEAFPERPVEVGKAWREQVHRHIAALLGLMVLGMAAMATRARRFGWTTVFGASALVAIAIPLYMREYYVTSSVLVVIAEAALLSAAWRWSNSDLARVATFTLGFIILQAMLGLWTVTWLLKPIVVMAHLMGGMTMLCLLTWMAWRSTPGRELPVPAALRLRPMLVVATVLVAIQIALGGWVSANYASMACGTDFPTCLGQWWPQMDFAEALVLWRGIGVDYEGGLLDPEARAAIQMMHRLFAIVVIGHLSFAVLRLIKLPALRTYGWAIGGVLALQVALGITNVLAGLPIAVATAHLAVAAVLLFLLIGLLARMRTQPV
ncbi:MAG: COX15/CtaA family protein [Aquimonas sp.]|nr:COX15/CtaA family protein [Aquimonas sp.]